MSYYVIIDSTDLEHIDLSEFTDTNVNRVRHSLDGSQCILEYNGEMPATLNQLTPKPVQLTYEEADSVLQSSAWYVEGFIEIG